MREIPQDQIVRRLEAENPWWQAPHRVASIFRKWTPRPYLDLFYPLVAKSRVRRAVVLMGPRRVGKTVLIHHAIDRLLREEVKPRSILYVTVDHPLYNGLALEEILALFAEATGTDVRHTTGYVFFDEIQYLRDWEVHLKALVDTYPDLRIVASGSAAAALRLKSHESGAGRFTNFLLPPLTFYEYLELLGETDLVTIEEGDFGPEERATDIEALNERFVHYLNFGGYPEVVLSEEIQSDPGRFIKSDIIDKVLLRDLPSLYGIQDIQELNSLFTTLAYNTAGEVSLEELAKRSGVAKNTLKRYIEYLEAAFLVRVVHRVDRDGRRFKRAVKFKVYLTNPSIRAALFSPVGADDPAVGALVETAVFAQWFHSERRLHYARWGDQEVDLVGRTVVGDLQWAVEAKWSDRFVDRPEGLAALVHFCQRNKLEGGAALVTTRTRRETRTIDGIRIDFEPTSEYCYTVGRNLIQNKALGR